MSGIGGGELELAPKRDRRHDFQESRIDYHQILAPPIHHNNVLRVRIVDDCVRIFADLDICFGLQRVQVKDGDCASAAVRTKPEIFLGNDGYAMSTVGGNLAYDF